MKIKALILATLTAGLIGCADQPPEPIQTPAELGYVDVQPHIAAKDAVTSIRYTALHDTAMTIGAQGALAWRSLQINNALKQQSKYLDHVYNFNSLLIKNHVLPPVLVENDGALNMDSTDTIRISDKTYVLLIPARFVSTPPNWRQYLWMNFEKPKQPNATILPKNKKEILIWNHFVKIGWKRGLTQATQIFTANLHRLQRDFLGMVLYRKLREQNMISPLIVAKSTLGVTGNAHQLNINDRVLRITGHAALRTDTKNWQAVIQKAAKRVEDNQ